LRFSGGLPALAAPSENLNAMVGDASVRVVVVGQEQNPRQLRMEASAYRIVLRNVTLSHHE
jgi:hypothetical protein